MGEMVDAGISYLPSRFCGSAFFSAIVLFVKIIASGARFFFEIAPSTPPLPCEKRWSTVDGDFLGVDGTVDDDFLVDGVRLDGDFLGRRSGWTLIF